MPPANEPAVDLGLNLALAVVATSHTPVLLLDEYRKVVAASDAFCRMFEIECASIVGREFASLGDREWAIPQLQSLLKATGAGLAEVKDYEFGLNRPDRKSRCLMLNAHKLDYGADGAVRMLLSISDITEARNTRKLNDELVRDKGLLLQELQHRVANSLQIIASVLMQSAKKVQSEEARTHLHDARNRVMSIAAVQKQLAVASADRVRLRPYLSQLCDSLGASMIHDHDRIGIDVTCDDSSVDADISISLGLVVTELVINALKHAFPDQRSGTIAVSYTRHGEDWTLSITDNGIGMPAKPGEAKAGLGTNIVQALAKQVEAEISIKDAKPGTAVSLTHKKRPGHDANPAGAEHVAV